MTPDSLFWLLIIVSMFLPITAFVGAIILLFQGHGGLALVLFVWWLLWEE